MKFPTFFLKFPNKYLEKYKNIWKICKYLENSQILGQYLENFQMSTPIFGKFPNVGVDIWKFSKYLGIFQIFGNFPNIFIFFQIFVGKFQKKMLEISYFFRKYALFLIFFLKFHTEIPEKISKIKYFF